jgi:GT2 family glycosyltransferase
MSPPLVSIVVLNWNGSSDTLACMDSLAALTYPNFNVIVVDNGSIDDSLDKLRTYSSPYSLVLLQTGRNLGYAGGNNVGTRHALEHGADFVLVLNNDTTVATDLLEQLMDAARRNPDAGVFSARVMYFNNPEIVWFDGACWNASALQLEWPGQGASEVELGTIDHDTDYACGAALFFRAEVARQIGLLDEVFFLVWEEVDWSFRARRAGWRCLVVPAARIWHKIGVSFGSESSPLRMYFSIRNELLWFSRHAPMSARLRLWTKNLRRLIPKFHISANPGVSFGKRFVWAIQDYGQTWLGRGERLEYLAARRAIVDYVHHRFGDCPDEVRAWSRAWAAQQHNS